MYHCCLPAAMHTYMLEWSLNFFVLCGQAYSLDMAHGGHAWMPPAWPWIFLVNYENPILLFLCFWCILILVLAVLPLEC